MQKSKIRENLKEWYRINKRDLPWRHTRDPYFIWVSEVVLQQTRVVQGVNYYERFITRFPDVQSLAQAEEEEVLKLWQGLGYYSRARNMHKAAQIIVYKHNTIFPKTHKELLALPGIGDYTAAAIASFAYNLPYAVVDGNVFRVLSRLYADATPIDTTFGKKHFSALADQLLDKQNPALHNQAMMELGALQCTPASPDCENCPLQTQCKAYKSNMVEQLPVKEKRVAVRRRYFNYFYVESGEHVFIRKRTAKDVWKNLYELPLIETEKETELSELMLSSDFATIFGKAEIDIKPNYHSQKHVLTHQRIFARLYRVKLLSGDTELKDFLKIPLTKLADYPLSRLTELLLSKIGIKNLR